MSQTQEVGQCCVCMIRSCHIFSDALIITVALCSFADCWFMLQMLMSVRIIMVGVSSIVSTRWALTTVNVAKAMPSPRMD